MRIVLHTGKGGVGKTTLSAATAIAAAAAGHRTLLLSTDPAHSVSDVLALPVGPDPAPVADVPGLWAAQVDTRSRFEQAWSQIRGYLVGVLAARGMAEVQAEEVTVLPGADEIVALLEVHRHATQGRFDVLVVDCAPSGESLKLLALPETIQFYADRLMSAPARLLRSIAAGLGGISSSRSADRSAGRPVSGPAADPAVGDALGDLLAQLTATRDLLADATMTRIRLVVTPERMVIAEARRLFTAPALHGFAVESVLVNRLLPVELEGTFLRSWRKAQLAAMPLIAESFPQLPVRTAALRAQEPVGVQQLAAVAQELFGGADPVDGKTPLPGMRTDGADGRYRLHLPLPLADRGQLELSRSGTDLVVTLGRHRRRIALPSTLQRCRTTGAHFAADTLVIDFEPDPDQWPASLAGVADRSRLAGAR